MPDKAKDSNLKQEVKHDFSTPIRKSSNVSRKKPLDAASSNGSNNLLRLYLKRAVDLYNENNPRSNKENCATNTNNKKNTDLFIFFVNRFLALSKHKLEEMNYSLKKA